MNRLAFFVELQDMSTLLTVLTQISCLGSKLTHVVAGENCARIAVLAPDRVTGHFANRLRKIIGVINLVEMSDDAFVETQTFVELDVIHQRPAPGHGFCCLVAAGTDN